MAGLKKLLAGIRQAGRVFGGLIAALLATLLGSIDWYAPEWMRFIGRRLRAAWDALVASTRARPARMAGVVVALLVLIGAGIGGWRWYQHLPKPQLVRFDVTAPARTCYECDPPGAPNALRVRFSESVAPIEAAGKSLDEALKQFTLTPVQPGKWQWVDDKVLSFEPSADWPVGQVFKVGFARKKFVAGHQKLDKYDFEFTAPAFEATAKNTEFYQDPQVATGIVDADSTERTLDYVVPDHFNGKLRVIAVAVAVSDGAIGVYEGATLVRGDFILSPNAPTFVAPGDSFEVSLGVSNQAEGSGKDAKLALKLVVGKGLEVVGVAEHTLAVAEGHESSIRYRLKATDDLADARLTFTSALGAKSAKRVIGMSVRPATPYRTLIKASVVKPGAKLDVPVMPNLYPQFREQEAGISALPMGLASGFVSYLGNYPYSCTEQLVSQAMPALVMLRRPDFGHVERYPKADFNGLLAELRSRQNPDGAYRYWPGSFETHEFVSVYAQHVLIEAGERGQTVPRDLLEQGNVYLHALASRDGNTLDEERNSAYALYLLTRQGQTQGAEASRLRERLESRYADEWRSDLATAYLAAAMRLMKQDREADNLFSKIQLVGKRPVIAGTAT